MIAAYMIDVQLPCRIAAKLLHGIAAIHRVGVVGDEVDQAEESAIIMARVLES
jgi:hypothetical protein